MYNPGHTHDKEVSRAVPRRNYGLERSRTAEPLPNSRMAIATSGQNPWDGILLFDSQVSLNDYEAQGGAPYQMQNVTRFPAVRAMIWDDQGQTLWAAGTDAGEDGLGDKFSNLTLKGYPFDKKLAKLSTNNVTTHKLNHPFAGNSSWKGSHWWTADEIIPVPNQRKFIITTSIDFHVFDVDQKKFTDSGKDVISDYLTGFEPVDKGRGGQFDLTRSNVTSGSLASDGSFVYVQATPGGENGNGTNYVKEGKKYALGGGRSIEVSRARFFADTPGWQKTAYTSTDVEMDAAA